MFKIFVVVIASFSRLLCSFNAIADSNDEVFENRQKTIISNISKKLRENYVFPNVANKVAKQLLLNLNHDKYLGYDEIFIFADRLTDDIQEITHDKHIRVKLRQPGVTININEDVEKYFRKVEILDGNVGLITFDKFPSDPKAKEIIDRILSQLTDVDSLIIDLRNNQGGRAVNPITKTNWEGVSVTPHLPVIAVLAFEEAYAMAKYSAIENRVSQSKAKPEEKYSIKHYQKDYGKWTLAKNSCPLKYRWAQAEYNDRKNKYQFPYQIKYYGNGSANIEYQLGNTSEKMTHTLHFKNRKDEKSGISIGFSTFDKVSILKCEILKD
jgi:hypothetical protein